MSSGNNSKPQPQTDEPVVDIDTTPGDITMNETMRKSSETGHTSQDSSVSDATIMSLKEPGEFSDLNQTDPLFDESELLGTSSQVDNKSESSDASNPESDESDQDSTLEAETSSSEHSPKKATKTSSSTRASKNSSSTRAKSSSTGAKENSSPNGANENSSPTGANENPSPLGATEKKDKGKKENQAGKKNKKLSKTEAAETRAPSKRTTRNTAGVDYKSLHTGKTTPKTDTPKPQGNPDQKTLKQQTTEINHLKSELQKAQEEVERKSEELDEQKARSRQLEKVVDSLRREAREREGQQDDTLESLRENLKAKEDEIAKTKENLANEKQRRKEAMKEKKKEKRENENLKTKLNEKDQENTDLQTQVANLQTQIDNLNQDYEDLRTRLEETEQMNDTLLKSYIEKQEKRQGQPKEENPHNTEPKTKAMLISDSNRKHITPHLETKNTDWSVVNTVYTAEETLAFLDNRDHRDTIKDQNIVIIMQGTNDIRGSIGRRESNGSEAFHNLSDAAKTINRLGPKVLITQIPPMTKPRHDIETAVLNTRLESTESKYFTTIKTSELRKNTKEKILENDGFHLTDLGGKIVAEAINKATKTTKKQEKTDITIHKI